MKEHEIGNELFYDLNDFTIKKKINIWNRNGEKNGKLLDKWGGMRPIDLRKKDAFIIGAGESFDDNVEYLKANYHKFFIIATDMALRPLLLHGIKPQICISVEIHQTPFFDGLETKDITLLAYSVMSPSNLRKWQGPIMFFNVQTDSYHLNKIYKRAKFKRLGFLNSGGNVSSLALSFAYSCFARSIVFVGNDLGYKDRVYCKETVRSLKSNNTTERLRPIETIEKRRLEMRKLKQNALRVDKKNNDNGKTLVYYTDPAFLGCKKWIEECLENNNINNVFCTSEMGIMGKTKKIYFKKA